MIKRHRRTRAGAAALLAALVGCAAPEPRLSEESIDGLQRVENAALGAVFLRPDAQLGSYEALWIRPLQIYFRRQPRASRGEFPLSEEQERRLADLFQEVFREELAGGGGLRLAAGPGAGVLELEPAIANLVVTAPPEPRGAGSFVLIQQTADLTLVAELRDAESGELLARVADRRIARRGAGGAYESTPINNRAAVRQVFRHWATRMRAGLERARELGF